MARASPPARLGGRVTDISHAVETYVRAARATTASSRTTSATASARRCTSRPTCPTTAGRPRPQAGRGPGAGGRADGDPRQQATPRARRRVDRRHRRRLAGRPTSSTPSRSPPTAPGCSPRSTAASRARPSSACRSAAADRGPVGHEVVAHGTMGEMEGSLFSRGGVVSTARTLVRPGAVGSISAGRRVRPERKRPPEKRSRRRTLAVLRRTPQLRRRELVNERLHG